MANPSPKTDHLKPWQFRPGQTGNPGGRAKLRMTSELRRLLKRGVLDDRLFDAIERAGDKQLAGRIAIAALKVAIGRHKLVLREIDQRIRLEEIEFEERIRRIEEGRPGPAVT